jgi:hypothetical protein
MPTKPDHIDPSSEFYFSPVRGGPFRRLRHAIGLFAEGGAGLLPRVVALVALAWLPVVAGALIAGQALSGSGADPLFRHFGVHARFLIALPLLIFAEGFMERIIPPMIRHLATSGLVDSETMPKFREALATATRVRDSIWGSVLVIAVIAAMVIGSSASSTPGDEMAWAVGHSDGQSGFGFAGWWFTFVSRPIFISVLVIWVWRMLALWVLVWKVSTLDLRLVASHPDRVGGLGFMEGSTVACAPVVLAISVVLAGRWAHEVLYHGVHVDAIKPLAIAFLVTMLVAFNGPLLVLGRNIRSFKRARLMEYSALVGNHGHLVYRKWIRNQDVGTPEILAAAELGPTVDISSIYEAVARMRFAPIGKGSVLPIAVACVLPLLPVFAIEIPIKQLLGSLAKTLL